MSLWRLLSEPPSRSREVVDQPKGGMKTPLKSREKDQPLGPYREANNKKSMKLVLLNYAVFSPKVQDRHAGDAISFPE